ncbi:UvrD-like helicase family protein [Nitrosospira sp. Nsp2]|uniref:UvrD-helicase domain-containing protein n=1 Tax=Nitrosospira sp. Nsp2 TaxID=136548 RepID=UPI000D326AEC|nr:UvrD-helicase domain-containing protein [Nitrosospira sp. Nsp2]PTR17226.1 UvrD-like helicase family protein [Nitrosospira sp. Nsp2]
MTFKPKVALSQEFLGQLAKLPAAVYAKVMKWATRFQADPTSPGINYENINGARDPNLKSVRLDNDWRGIVFKPTKGDVYVLLYVDHHDDAYRWAENRRLTINPVTGAMQLVVLEHVIQQEERPQNPVAQGSAAYVAATQDARPLFAELSDHELMSLGVPQEIIARVRGLTSEAQLDAIQLSLPVEAYEGLFLVVAGDTVSQILMARETRVDQVIDAENFAASLETPEAQSRFVVVADDEAMRTIMNAPLAQWRVFLHPTQKKLASDDHSGPMRVLGQAGTGKTVLAIHRARWLAENRTPDGQKVLFTTFTKNLATDIKHNLRTLCSAATMAKIEVSNLDAWVGAFIRGRKLEHRIVYDRKRDAARQAWESALASKDSRLELPDDFYEHELEQVVLAQGITTLAQYRVARRTGRGVVLNRAKRDAVWPVFEEYRGQLASRKLKEVDDAYREVAETLGAESASAAETHAPPYSAIVVDETQDLGPQALTLLRAMIPAGSNDLFFVGDGHQRIYSRNRAVMSRCGIEIRGRSRKLYLNYRTTDEIRRQAVALLEGCDIDDLDGGSDENSRYKSLSHGPEPKLIQVDGLKPAVEETTNFIKAWRTEQADVVPLSLCVITASGKVRDAMSRELENAGLACVTIDAQNNHADALNVVHLATMHRAKGLEFDCVVVLAPMNNMGDPTQTENQRKLLYVALTRAKRGAMLVQLP